MERFQPASFMLVPTMACQAACRYCFAKKDGARMDRFTLERAIDFISRVAPQEGRLQIVFHGGEPLLAGAAFYEYALPLLRRRFGARLRLSMQSNLWALTGPEGDRLAKLLCIYNVSVGTSLDWPEEICDAQRGKGYYRKTTAGMEVLRRYQIPVSTICTIGKDYVNHAGAVFAAARQSYALHGAVPTLDSTGDGVSLSADEMTRVLMDSYTAYRADPAHARVSTLDAMAGGCFHGRSGLCTFQNCLGRFAAIAPDGAVYSCQRFNGCAGFALGNVNSNLSENTILNSSAYRRLRTKQDGMARACGDCPHVACCGGGCLYNAFAGDAEKDPYCAAYRRVFDRLRVDMALEMAQELRSKLSGEPSSERLYPVLSMAGDRPHPHQRQQDLRAFRQALRTGQTRGDAMGFLRTLSREDYVTYCLSRLGTLYLNLTYRCPLRCTHCSANGGALEMDELPPARFAEIVQQACELGFRRIEFTGGELFAYSGFNELMERLERVDRRGTEWVFRTSFGFSIPAVRVASVCRLFDTLIVSIDGDEAHHDARRGPGTYRLAVDHLRAALRVPGRRCRFGLCAVLTGQEQAGPEGQAVRALAEELGIRLVLMKELLPLGRACGQPPEDLSAMPADVPQGFRPKYSCGIGRNLTIDPNGDVYPCYAWCGADRRLGNLGAESLETLLRRGTLFDYRLHGVDTNAQCAGCEVRYLCGGLCKAWMPGHTDFDAGGFACHKYAYYRRTADENG